MVEQRTQSPHHTATAAAQLQVRHEVCSPLTVIRGNAQLMRRRLAQLDGVSTTDERQLWQYLTAIEAATKQLAAVVDALVPRL